MINFLRFSTRTPLLLIKEVAPVLSVEIAANTLAPSGAREQSRRFLRQLVLLSIEATSEPSELLAEP
jgi:hypothetical protein